MTTPLLVVGLVAALATACGPSSAAPPAAPASAALAPVAPGSVAPGSVAPDSVAPDSVAPSSVAPASVAPASVAPASVAPDSVAPLPEGPPGELPTLVRKLLDGRMLRHGTDLGSLHNAMQAGDYAAVALHARNIADEPRIARPLPDDDTLNQTIPAEFFDVQDRLHDRAEALAAAAAARDSLRMRTAYEALGSTCARCHQLWFPMPTD